MRQLLPILLLCACNTTPTGEARGTWKASTKSDSVATCAGSCGGRSPGMCYCDAACAGWGDCCPDYQPVCAPGDLGGPGHVDLGPSYGPSDLNGPSGASDLNGPFGGPSDLSGPYPSSYPTTYDLLPAPVATGRFTANLDVQRTFYLNWNAIGAPSSITISVSCLLYGSSQISCGMGPVTLNSDGTFVASVQWEGGNVASISGKVLPGQVEVDTYNLATQSVSYSYFIDSWGGSQLSPIVAP
jgi:hypothetical protein